MESQSADHFLMSWSALKDSEFLWLWGMPVPGSLGRMGGPASLECVLAIASSVTLAAFLARGFIVEHGERGCVSTVKTLTF